MGEKFLTVQEIFKMAKEHDLANHIKTVYRWIDKEILTSVKQGKYRLISQDSWDQFVASKTTMRVNELEENRNLKNKIKKLELLTNTLHLKAGISPKKAKLQDTLLANNSGEIPDWNYIKDIHSPELVEVNGQPVYIFNGIFDDEFNQVEESIYISQQPPFAFIPMHLHNYIELIYVYQGNCKVLLKDEEIDMLEGGLIMIDKKTPHTTDIISDKDIIIEIKLKHDYLTSEFISQFNKKSIITQFLIDSLIDSRRENNYLYFPFEEESNISRTMEYIMCEYYNKDFISNEIIKGYLFILFTELIRNGKTVENPKNVRAKKNNEGILDFLKYIEEHYRDCSLDKMAKHYNYHPNYISFILKKATGKSFKELLQIQKLNKAALYLSNSDLPISDIAEEVGYSSLSFFYKKFNSVFLQTPKEYRDSNKFF